MLGLTFVLVFGPSARQGPQKIMWICSTDAIAQLEACISAVAKLVFTEIYPDFWLICTPPSVRCSPQYVFPFVLANSKSSSFPSYSGV